MPSWATRTTSGQAGSFRPPPITAFFAQITPLIAVAGIIALFVGDVPVWVGIALIVVGVGLTKVLSSPKPVVAA